MREYVISTGGQTISGTTTLTYIRASGAPQANLEFLRHWINQSNTATSSQCRVQLALSSGSPTAAAFTPIKQKEIDPISSIVSSTTPAAGNCGVNVTTEVANRTVVWDDAFNVLNGWLHIPTPPETRVQPAGATSGFTQYFPVSPTAGLVNWSWGLLYREV